MITTQRSKLCWISPPCCSASGYPFVSLLFQPISSSPYLYLLQKSSHSFGCWSSTLLYGLFSICGATSSLEAHTTRGMVEPTLLTIPLYTQNSSLLLPMFPLFPTRYIKPDSEPPNIHIYINKLAFGEDE